MLTANTDIGIMYRIWALVNTATAPTARNEASAMSVNVPRVTTPRPATPGMKRRTTSRSSPPVRSSDGVMGPAMRRTRGSCTANCATPPRKTPQAPARANSMLSLVWVVQIRIAVMMAMFHNIGAT